MRGLVRRCHGGSGNPATFQAAACGFGTLAARHWQPVTGSSSLTGRQPVTGSPSLAARHWQPVIASGRAAAEWPSGCPGPASAYPPPLAVAHTYKLEATALPVQWHALAVPLALVLLEHSTENVEEPLNVNLNLNEAITVAATASASADGTGTDSG